MTGENKHGRAVTTAVAGLKSCRRAGVRRQMVPAAGLKVDPEENDIRLNPTTGGLPPLRLFRSPGAR